MRGLSRKFVLTAAAGLAGVLWVAVHVNAHTPDRTWVGTWVLNVAKSSYDPGPPPRGAVSYLEADPAGEGWIVEEEAVDAEGDSPLIQATVKFDGKAYPVMGIPDTTWAFTTVDDHTYEMVAKRAGKVVATARSVVSPDGKTRTTTTTGTNERGQKMKNVAVYERR